VQLEELKRDAASKAGSTAKIPLIGYLRSFRLTWHESLGRCEDFVKSEYRRNKKEPSVGSFLLLAVLISIFFLPLRWPSLPSSLSSVLDAVFYKPSDADGKFSDLIVGAFTGLAVVVIALVIFVAESIRDNADVERKRVLLQLSYIWPLGFAITVIPFGFLWTGPQGLTIVLEILLACLTLIAFGSVINSLLDPGERERSRVALVKRRIRDRILDSVRERVGNNILLQSLGPGKRIPGLQYALSKRRLSSDPKKYVFIDAENAGRIVDIQMGELQRLIAKLNRYARTKLSFSLAEGAPNIVASERTEAPPEGPFPVRNVYLLKRLGEDITGEFAAFGRRDSILALPEGFERNPALLAETRASVTKIFRVSTEESPSTVFRNEIQATKDQLVSAIRGTALGAVDELKNSYLHIAEEFIRLLVEYGGAYNADAARKEMGTLIGGWSEVRWITEDFRELITIASQTDNPDIIRKVCFLPYAVAGRALSAQDHYFFQQFISFSPFIYLLGSEKPSDSRARSVLIDRSWRYLKELAEYYIFPQLEDPETQTPDLDNYRDFLLYVLRVYMNLLKVAAEKIDLETAKTLTLEFKKLYALDSDYPSKLAGLRYRLSHAATENDRASLQDEVERQEKYASVIEEIALGKQQVDLAIAGHILAKLLERPDRNGLADVFAIIRDSLPNDLTALTDAYSKASRFGAGDFWGWTDWDIPVDGEVHWIDTHSKLDRIFVVRALDCLASLSAQERDSIVLTPSYLLSERTRNASGPTRFIEEISQGRLDDVVSAKTKAQTDLLREKLLAACNDEELDEAERTRSAALDPTRLADFRSSIIESLRTAGRLRSIFKAAGAYSSKLDNKPGKSVPSLGYNRIDDKNAFIIQEHVGYSGWGEAYGDGLGRAEDDSVASQLIRKAGTQMEASGASIVSAIQQYIVQTQMAEPIIFQTLGVKTEHYHLRSSVDFIPNHDPRAKRSKFAKLAGFMGVVVCGEKDVPIFDIMSRSETAEKVLIADFSSYATWEQYSPVDVPSEDESYVVDELLVRVIDLNADAASRNKIVDARPAWLETETDKAEVLRGKVLVNVYEKFRVVILDSAAAVCLSLTQGNDDGDQS